MPSKNPISVFIQDTIHKRKKLSKKQCEKWLGAIAKPESDITVRIVTLNESRELNQQYRNKIGATNILSFLMSEDPIEGDLVLCHSIVKKEAKDQGKKILDHYAHLIIHGYLHLLGYDHQNKADADKMEMQEKKILNKFNINDPYRDYK
ncbi:MAG: rRNA maturation RNase YbeY [Nitrosomonadales bacterium]|jgi:probable rRNA maturation factor|nr:rRNA maturation RNase YbeY [Nitrosomonadales bacterium]MBT3918724.1 rRNA maturation RNase YbeY [Nitrosomonadales bacterium]MBT4183409.1 rRNA maturation RNase YbeY [Nitrosomonadales bacterium]MBT4571094.1 rRNA maturation RNase YbeY [Nitrosomonadales bacterium]MBT4759114.1 rRNA maturation RNase YbeY [Nitrosomonadales bacterium]